MTAMLDLSKLFGLSWCLDADTEDDTDATLRTATVTLAARRRLLNLSPLVFDEDNRINPLNYDSTSLLQAGRRIVIESATLPLGGTRELADMTQAWDVEFEGEISRVGGGDNGTITLECSPRALQKTWIEPDPVSGGERIYGAALGTPIEAELQQLVDDHDPSKYIIVQIEDSGPSNEVEVMLFTKTTVGRGKPIDIGADDVVFIEGCAAAVYNGEHVLDPTEVSHTDEEVRLTTATAGGVGLETPTPDGILWTQYGYKGGKPDLWVPVATLINAYEWLQSLDRDVLSALQEAMAQFGWQVRQAYDDERQMHRWAITSPAAAESAGVIGLEQRYPTNTWAKDSDSTRNINVTEFGSVDAQDNLGLDRKYVESAVAKASVRLFGRLYSRIGVASTGLVKRPAEASDLASTVVGALQDDAGEVAFAVRHRVDIDPGDTCTLGPELATMMPISVSQTSAPGINSEFIRYGIKRVRRRMGRSGWRTEMTLRDSTATGMRQRHFDSIQDAGFVQATGVLGPAKPAAPSVDVLSSLPPTEFEVSWGWPYNAKAQLWDTMEVHVSATTGFVPSAATMRRATRDTAATLRRYAAGTWYCKIVPRDSNGNAGEASDQTAFVV